MSRKKHILYDIGKGGTMMLKEFSFRNCYSFREDVTFSMEANHAMKDNINFVVSRGKAENIVFINPVAAIYGSNAGGKSNMLRALNNAVKNIHVGFGFRNIRFFLTSEKNEVFMHKLIVVIGDVEYEYQYEANTNNVFSESLYLRDLTSKNAKMMIFEREKDTIKTSFNGEQPEAQVLVSAAANTRILVMKTLGEIGFDTFEPFYKWCGSVASVMRVLGERERQDILNTYALELHEDDEKSLKFSEFMSSFDSSIYGVKAVMDSTENTGSDDTTINKKPRLFVVHRGSDTEGHPLKGVFPTELESNGTKKLMELYPLLIDSLEKGTPFVCDELDTFLHPLIFKRIVAMFNDKDINKFGAQLIFSAHSTIVMNRECLRRDEIYFIDKDNEGISSAFRLSDVVDEDGNKIRMDARYDRLYMNGILGAIPYGFYNAKI